jgi:hypothetical protein
MASSELVAKDNHQAQIARYLDSASSIVLNPYIASEAIVLVLHVWLDILLCVSFQRCSPVEEISALSVLYGDLWITTAIDDLDSIRIGMCTFHHEALEVGIFHAVISLEIVEFFPHDTLDLCVLRLHVTYGNSHDLTICCIIHVIRHSRPLLDILDMVKHEPRILQISSWLHALDEVHTTSRSVFQHLEDIHLFLALTWKNVAMDVLNCGVRFHSHDAIIGSSFAAASIE